MVDLLSKIYEYLHAIAFVLDPKLMDKSTYTLGDSTAGGLVFAELDQFISQLSNYETVPDISPIRSGFIISLTPAMEIKILLKCKFSPALTWIKLECLWLAHKRRPGKLHGTVLLTVVYLKISVSAADMLLGRYLMIFRYLTSNNRNISNSLLWLVIFANLAIL
jgi:hypothetical protein